MLLISPLCSYQHVHDHSFPSITSSSTSIPKARTTYAPLTTRHLRAASRTPPLHSADPHRSRPYQRATFHLTPRPPQHPYVHAPTSASIACPLDRRVANPASALSFCRFVWQRRRIIWAGGIQWWIRRVDNLLCGVLEGFKGGYGVCISGYVVGWRVSVADPACVQRLVAW